MIRTSARNENSLLYLNAVHQENQETERENPMRPSNQYNNAIFDNVDVRRYFVEIDGIRYPKDPIDVCYTENISLDQYRNPKLFVKENFEESLVSPLKSCLDMKIIYSMQTSVFAFEIDHVTLKKIQLLDECNEAPANTNS